MNTAPFTWQILLKPTPFEYPKTIRNGELVPDVGPVPEWAEGSYHRVPLTSVLLWESRAGEAVLGSYVSETQDISRSVKSLVQDFSRFLWKNAHPVAAPMAESPPECQPEDLLEAASLKIHAHSDGDEIEWVLPEHLEYPSEELIPWAAEQKFQVEVYETGLTDQGRTELLSLLRQHFPEQCSTESLKLITV